MRDAAPAAVGARPPADASAASTPSNRPASPSRAASRPPPAARGLHRQREDFRVGRLDVLAAEAFEAGLDAFAALGRRPGRGRPGRDRNIPRPRRPLARPDRRGRRGSCIRAGGKAPRPRRRRSGTAGRESPRRTCRERSTPAGGSAARCAGSRPRGNARAPAPPALRALGTAGSRSGRGHGNVLKFADFL